MAIARLDGSPAGRVPVRSRTDELGGQAWIAKVAPENNSGELTRLRGRPGWGAMFTTLSGRIQHPPGAVSKSSVCLTAPCAVKQPKDFLGLASIEHVGQDAALQPRR
jgi:hypothetical protein